MRLIFINFAIDNLWDQSGALRTLFPMRIPQSERLVRAHEDLGAFLADAGDFVLMANPVSDVGWQPNACIPHACIPHADIPHADIHHVLQRQE